MVRTTGVGLNEADVVALIGAWQTQQREIERLRALLEPIQAERDELRSEVTTLEWQLSEATKAAERLRVISDEWSHWHTCTHTNRCWSGEAKQA